jgi:hypothetical protein
MRMEMSGCDTYWRTHGCDLPRGHDGPHMCCPHLGEPGRCQNIDCDDNDCVDAHLCHNETPNLGDRLCNLAGQTLP